MQKYLAVIKDSFREAIASRVLWVVMVLITLLLVIVAPMSYREDLTWKLGDNDVREWPDLMELVREQQDNSKASPARRIWSLLDEKMQKRLAGVKIPGKDSDAANPFEFLNVFGDFKRDVNKLLERRDFYDKESFADVQMLSQELRDLRDEEPDKLGDAEVARFNRLLMEASFPDLVRGSPPTSIQLTYGWSDFGDPYPLRGANLRESLQAAVAFVMKWFVGAIGVFVAVLVTAPIIPQMFDPGALHLLLSKPISRWMLFLAKFFGGCAFILIGATYLIGGLWLILGVRFGVWDAKLLLSIPIYMFVFAIYYSVSALIGVVWRSPIVCVALTILFWLACFLIGSGKIGFETFVWNKARLVRLIETEEELLAVNEAGLAYRWNDGDREWKEVFVSQDQKQSRGFLLLMPSVPRELLPVGPLYDPDHQRLLAGQPTFPPTKVNFYVGSRNDDWEPVSNVAAPTGMLAMFREKDGHVLVVSSMGLYRLVGDPLKKLEPYKLLGYTLPLPSASPFKTVSPDPPVLMTQPAAAARNDATGELALYTRGKITVVSLGERGVYEKRLEHQLDGEERQPAVLGFGGNTLVVGRDDGRVQVLDAATFEMPGEFQPEGPNQPRFVNASPDGRRFAIVFHNGHLWLYDAQTHDLQRARVAGQGDISCAQFSADGKLLVVDQTLRVSVYEPESGKLAVRHSPRLGMLARGYRYGLVPLYTIFPKPGELDKTFQYFLSGKETESENREDLSMAQQDLNPWMPLWSSALFTLVVLVAACLYIEWQDF